MSEYFPPYVVSTNNNIKVVLDLSGYAKEDDLAYFRDKDYIDQIYLVFEPKYEFSKHLIRKILPMFHHGNRQEHLMKKLSQPKQLAMTHLLH